MRRFVFRPLVIALCASGISLVSTDVLASSFQLFEQDGASVGTYHAGYAAEAADASVAWYNPAGIPLIKNQQVATGGSAIMTSFKYKGTVTVNSTDPASNGVPQQTTAQGGAFGIVPFLHYVAPLSERLGFGFSIDAPFGLETDYGRETPVQYASTLSQVTVIDISPSLGYMITDKASIGAGLDIQPMQAEFDAVGGFVNPSDGLPITSLNTESVNKATDTGYGAHFGALYQFNQDARIGLSYHSKVRHHLSGSSTLVGEIGQTDGVYLNSDRAIANITLPPYTALSGYYKPSSAWAFMASVIYTQWNVLQQLELLNVAGLDTSSNTTTDLTVTIPQRYSNTWQVSVGANYYATERVMLRGGLGFDQTPVSKVYRNTRLPDNNRYVLAVGGHFQATKTIGLDLGYNHFMMNQARVNPPTQQTGALLVNTNGSANGGADVFSGQITWDLL